MSREADSSLVPADGDRYDDFVADQKGFGTGDHRRRVDALGEELDLWRRQFDAAKAEAQDRRSHVDRRRSPRGIDRRRTDRMHRP